MLMLQVTEVGGYLQYMHVYIQYIQHAAGNTVYLTVMDDNTC